MKVAFPFMGHTQIPLRGLLINLGCEVIVPPKPNRSTVETGARLSPELMCIPFKITLGSLLKAMEMGADTIIHTGGSWSCRYGYYGRLHQDIIRSLGYRFSAFIIRRDELPFIYKKVRELNNGSLSKTLLAMAKAFRCGWNKSSLIELAEAEALRLRAYELEKGKADQLLNRYYQLIDQTFSVPELKKLSKRIIEDFKAIPTDYSRNPLKIKIVGESYCVIEPLVNFNLIVRLGNMGILADPFLTTHHWLGFHSLRIGKGKTRAVQQLAQSYWRYNVGGEDMNSIGHTILAAKQGYDGVIHLHPFACMPATMSQPILEKVSRDYNIPLLFLSLDEHTQEVGFYNRVEAFVSVLERRRSQKLKA